MKKTILTFVLGAVAGGATAAGFFMTTPVVLAPESQTSSAPPQTPSGHTTIIVPVDDPNRILGDAKTIYTSAFRVSVEGTKDGRMTRINLIH